MTALKRNASTQAVFSVMLFVVRFKIVLSFERVWMGLIDN